MQSELKTYTITMTIYLPFKIKIRLLSKFTSLCDDNVICKKYGTTFEYLPIYQSLKNKKKIEMVRIFYNQCTLVMRIRFKKCIEVKIFNTGYIHMTGCYSHNDGCITLLKLFDILTELKVYNMTHKITNKSKYMIAKYVSDIDAVKKLMPGLKIVIELNHIFEYDISNIISNYCVHTIKMETVMINTGYKLNMSINREELHKLLRYEYKLNSSYDPLVYVAINLKYKTDTNEYVTVLIFITGSIILSHKKYSEIRKAYNFINKCVKDNYSKIKGSEILNKTPNIKRTIFSRRNNIILYVMKRTNKKNVKTVYTGFS